MADSSSLGAIIALAIFTEATVQILVFDTPSPLKKYICSPDREQNQVSCSLLRWLSVLVGIAYAFNMDLDIFDIMGFPSKISYLGEIATGVIASRGVDYIKEIISRITNRNTETIV